MDLVARALALTKSAVHVKQFGAKGDGINSDDDAFELMIQHFRNNPGAVVEFDPTGVYVIERNHYFPSGVTMLWNGATLLSRCDSGGADNSQDRNIGMFNFWGALDPVKTTVTSLAGLEGDWTGTDSQSMPHDGKITLQNADLYSVGDFLYLDVSTGNYSSSKLNPKERKVLRVIGKVGNTLTVDYTSPWRYQDYTFTATVQKCYPCQNVVIKDINIHDELVLDVPKNPNINTPGTENFVSCLSFNYAYNIDIRGVKGTNTKFPVVHVFNTSLGVVEDGHLSRPAVVGSGEGYLAQFVHCKNIYVKRVSGDECRHIVDFTNSAFCDIENVGSSKAYSNAIQLHGHYEHNICFRNTVGGFGASSGQSFGEANMRIALDNHTGWISGSYMADYTVKRSKIRLRKLLFGTIEDSDVWLFLDNPYNHDPRSVKNKRKTEFINCITEVYSSSGTSTVQDMALLSFRRGKLVNVKNPTTGFLLHVSGIDDLRFDDLQEMRGILVRPSGSKDTRVSFAGSNIFSGDIDNYILKPLNASGAKITATISRDVFVSERTGGKKGKFYNMPTSDATVVNVTQQIIIEGNDINNAEILGEAVNGGINDMYLSRGNKIVSSTVTVSPEIPHLKEDDITF